MKKKYFKLTEATDPELIGINDGSAQAEVVRKQFLNKNNFDLYFKHFLSHGAENIQNQLKFPEFDFRLEYIKFRKGAFATDFIYFGPAIAHRFLVSEKVQEILKEYNLPPYKLYETKLYSKKEFTDEYKFLFVPPFDFEYVDFKMSIFSKRSSEEMKEFIKINSGLEFIKLEFPIKRDKIVLTNAFNSKLDYFNLLVTPDPIISERLRNTFLNQGVTGIEMIELNESSFEIEN